MAQVLSLLLLIPFLHSTTQIDMLLKDIDQAIEIASYYPEATASALQHRFRSILKEGRTLRDTRLNTSETQLTNLSLMLSLHSTTYNIIWWQ